MEINAAPGRASPETRQVVAEVAGNRAPPELHPVADGPNAGSLIAGRIEIQELARLNIPKSGGGERCKPARLVPVDGVTPSPQRFSPAKQPHAIVRLRKCTRAYDQTSEVHQNFAAYRLNVSQYIVFYDVFILWLPAALRSFARSRLEKKALRNFRTRTRLLRRETRAVRAGLALHAVNYAGGVASGALPTR